MSDDTMSKEECVISDYSSFLSRPDSALYNIVASASGDYEFPITVSSNGIIYSGILVSEGVWLRAQTKLYEETGSQDNADYCNRLASEYDDNPDDTITALHMKEVKIISHPTADMPVLMWRIRIDRVDAFHVGRMP